MERLDFDKEVPYSAVEASIHLNRYIMAKPLCKGKKVLDVASGEGYGSNLLKKWGAITVDALDIDPETIKKAKRLFGSEEVKFICHTAEELPYSDNTFDLITSFETIEHLNNPDKFLMEIKRVLKPGGTIIISCPNDPYYYKEENVSNPFHKQKYTYFDFKKITENYLGQNVKYYLAFAVNGFLNMPITRSTEPTTAKKPNMFEMLNFVECSDAFCVPQERYINHWNSNYYIGIWGKYPAELDISTVVFPRETFIDVKDEDIQLLRDVEKQTDKYQEVKEKLLELEEKLSEKEKCIANKEYIIYTLVGDCKEIKEKRNALKIENDRLSTMLELTIKENENWHGEDYWNLVGARNELEIIKSTKGYKMLNLIYRIRCKFRKKAN